MTDAHVERIARAMCFADYGVVEDGREEFWLNPNGNHWFMQDADEWDNGILVRLGREGYRRHAHAAIARGNEP